MVRYPVRLEPDDNGTLLVLFPDFPEAQTFGEDREEALARANDALATIVDGYIRSRRQLPRPSAITGAAATLSALMSAKVDIYEAMQVKHVTKTELSRLLNWHLPQVDRLLELNHGSRLDQLEAAACALGGRLELHLEGLTSGARYTVGLPHRIRRAARAAPAVSVRPARVGKQVSKQPASKKR